MAKKDKKNEAEIEEPAAPTDLDRELAGLEPSKRAALLMLVLGEQQASDIITYLSPKEVEALSAAMVSVSDVSQQAVGSVLDGFIEELRGLTNLGLGSPDYLEGVLKRALGPERSASVLSRILPSSSSKGLEILAWMTPLAIYEMIGDEHPQVIAIILSVLESDTAAEVLELLPSTIRMEVVKRIANLDTVQPSAMAELESVVAKQLAGAASAQAAPVVGGIKTAAKIMSRAKLDLEKEVFDSMKEDNEGLVTEIQDNMFEFEDFIHLDRRSMQTLVQALEQDELMLAFRGVPQQLVDHFLENMSERQALLVKDDMEVATPKPLAEIDAAQKSIVRQARKLQEAGEIIMASADSNDFI